jgi:hypothetical protein
MSLQGGCYSASPSRRFKAVLVGARWDPSGTTAQSGHGGIRREPPHSRDGFSAGSLRKRDSRFAFVFSYFCFCLFVFVLFCFLIFLVLFCCVFCFLLFFVFFTVFSRSSPLRRQRAHCGRPYLPAHILHRLSVSFTEEHDMSISLRWGWGGGGSVLSGYGGVRREPPHSRDGFFAGSFRNGD